MYAAIITHKRLYACIISHWSLLPQPETPIVEYPGAIIYQPVGIEESRQVYGAVPEGSLDGVNATFIAPDAFVPESVQVYLNGLLLTKLSDYNTSGVRTIILFSSPSSSERILVNYTKA